MNRQDAKDAKKDDGFTAEIAEDAETGKREERKERDGCFAALSMTRERGQRVV